MAPSFGLGLGLAAGCSRGAPTGLGGCFAAVLGFGRVAGAGLLGAWALAAAGLLAVGTGFEPVWEVSPAAFGGGVLDEDVVVVVDEVVLVVDVVESEAEERAVGDSGGPWASGVGVECWVLRVVRTRVRVRAPGVCARFPLVTCACLCWCGGIVSAVRARGLPGGRPYLLRDARVPLMEVVEGAEEASLDAVHVLLREVGVVLGGGVGARPQQRHEVGCHHVRAEL